MADKTAIEWCDATWNPVSGCSKVSSGCKFCFAERVTERFGRGKFTDVQLHPNRLSQPLHWRRPRRVFVNSMSDVFHEAVPDEFLDQVFAVMAMARDHTFQVLTKRPERMRAYLEQVEDERDMQRWARWSDIAKSPCAAGIFDELDWPLPNVWLGVSVEDQARADERIPLLLQTPAAVRFLSVEPLLGPVDLSAWLTPCSYYCDHEQPSPSGHHPERPGLDWVIVGGESGGPLERELVVSGALGATMGGPRLLASLWAKPEALAWVRSLRDQCVATGVPFFFKQWGGVTPRAGGRVLDGRTWDEFPSRDGMDAPA